jgi:dynein heavy chain
MDYGGWYDIDTPEREFRYINPVRFVVAMLPPLGGRGEITNRYVRHFNVIYVEPYSNDSLTNIFSSVLEWFFLRNSSPAFSKGI